MKNPCKDCITLPICKNILIEYIEIKWSFPYSMAYYGGLIHKCSLINGVIEKKLKNKSHSNYNINSIIKKMIEDEVENI